jgi:hypothetical protein
MTTTPVQLMFHRLQRIALDALPSNATHPSRDSFVTAAHAWLADECDPPVRQSLEDEAQLKHTISTYEIKRGGDKATGGTAVVAEGIYQGQQVAIKYFKPQLEIPKAVREIPPIAAWSYNSLVYIT